MLGKNHRFAGAHRAKPAVGKRRILVGMNNINAFTDDKPADVADQVQIKAGLAVKAIVPDAGLLQLLTPWPDGAINTEHR